MCRRRALNMIGIAEGSTSHVGARSRAMKLSRECLIARKRAPTTADGCGRAAASDQAPRFVGSALCAVDLDAIWGSFGHQLRGSALARDEAFPVMPHRAQARSYVGRRLRECRGIRPDTKICRLGLCAVDLDAIWGSSGHQLRGSALARDEAVPVTPDRAQARSYDGRRLRECRDIRPGTKICRLGLCAVDLDAIWGSSGHQAT